MSNYRINLAFSDNGDNRGSGQASYYYNESHVGDYELDFNGRQIVVRQSGQATGHFGVYQMAGGVVESLTSAVVEFAGDQHILMMDFDEGV